MPRDAFALALQRYQFNALPNATTRIEALLAHALDLLQLDHQSQARVGRYWPDELLPVQRRIPVPTIIEADGPHHLLPAQIVKDRKKDAAYTAAGFRVFRFTDRDLRRSAIACVESVIAAYQKADV